MKIATMTKISVIAGAAAIGAATTNATNATIEG
jgi:hypothetical protein